MFKTRLLSGIVLVIILIATVGTGGGLLFGFLALISLIGLSELYKVVDVQNKILGLTGYLGAVVYYGILYTGQMQYMTLLTIAFLVVLMAVYVFSFPTFKAEQVMTVFFGVFYVAVMLSYVYQTRMLEDGAVAVWLIFLSSWVPAFGTTHADYFYGPVPCTRELTPEEIDEDYERNTGKVILETFARRGIDPVHVPAVLCASHGPFTWGKDAAEAVYHAAVLEEVAKMAVLTLTIDPGAQPAPQHVLDKHFMRKHGPNAYYGQKK